MNLSRYFTHATLAFSLGFSALTSATIVEFQTSQGNFQVNLYDTTTPITVDNFLAYVNENAYNDSIIHRSIPDFIVQGGGLKFDGDAIPANAAITNEPVYSNVTGTIAMAKLSGIVNSATNQWFFNLADNSANLDLQNGGFTVFGQVIGDGMDVVNAIADMQRCGDIPVVDFDCQSTDDPAYENLAVIYAVTIVDSSSETDASLTKPENVLINAPVPEEESKSSGGGGSTHWSLLGLLIASGLVRSRKLL